MRAVVAALPPSDSFLPNRKSARMSRTAFLPSFPSCTILFVVSVWSLIREFKIFTSTDQTTSKISFFGKFGDWLA